MVRKELATKYYIYIQPDSISILEQFCSSMMSMSLKKKRIENNLHENINDQEG